MDRNRWKEIDQAFERALDLSGSRREAFVGRLEDPDLRRAVEELLKAAETPGPFLEEPVQETCAPRWDRVFRDADMGWARRGEDRSGEHVGPYRLVRRLGWGGMATVYLAERADGLWEQEVALKLIRRGLESDDVVRRFLNERQILSTLRHPNIASLLDGGTTPEGLPYLVMEYVRGTPITTYCDERRMPVERRLELFCAVGHAVQHAHRSLVVHCDLKPSNILVTEEGRVKLLDFGIAKLLDLGADGLHAEHTRPARRALTPGYASPEQLTRRPVTTASDVFQLGALLYRLLCGARPYGESRWRPGTTAETWRRTPEPPSRTLTGGATWEEGRGGSPADVAAARGTTAAALVRKLRGDLDTIVLKALRAEPDERYDSAAAMVEDVERHLEQLPIRARAPTRRYRLRKFLGRNPWVGPVAAGAVLATAGYVFTLHGHARTLERERNVATAEAARAEAIQTFMTDLFESADPFATGDPERGRQITVAEALDRGTERARQELADQPALQADILGAIAGVYSSLDLGEPAAELRREAFELALRVHGPEAPELAPYVHALGNAQADPDSSETLLRSALSMVERHHGRDHPESARVLVSLGYLSVEQNRYDEAAAHLERAVSILDGAGPPFERLQVSALGALAQVYPHLNRTDEAADVGRRALDRSRELLGEDHPRTAMAMVHLAGAYDGLGQPERAVPLYRSALPIMEEAAGPEHTETIHTRNNLAVSLLQSGRPAEAADVLRRVVETLVQKHGERHADVADGLQNLAAALTRMGEVREAEATLQRARTVYLDVLGPDDYRAALPLLTLAQIRLDRAEFAGAEASASEAVRTLRRTLPEGHFATLIAECRWGLAMAGLERTAEATPLVEHAANALLATSQGGANRRACLEAAVEHLRSAGAARDRWAPIAAALEEAGGSP